jgi:hypothetical protein
MRAELTSLPSAAPTTQVLYNINTTPVNVQHHCSSKQHNIQTLNQRLTLLASTTQRAQLLLQAAAAAAYMRCIHKHTMAWLSCKQQG